MLALQCTIPSIVLHATPYNLSWASHIYANLIASNVYGNSATSVVGNGAVIYAVPYPPVNLTEDMTKRTVTTVGLYWIDGSNNGGLSVVDYRVTISSSSGNYNLVVSSLTNRSYVATQLTLGVTYNFIV
jgi:hypothetical protein